jgi:hypothetical protein
MGRCQASACFRACSSCRWPTVSYATTTSAGDAATTSSAAPTLAPRSTATSADPRTIAAAPKTAQLDAYLSEDLWLNNARHTNQMAARLREGVISAPGVSVLGDAAANILFCRFPQHPGSVRFVTSFAHSGTDIDTLLAAIRGLESLPRQPSRGVRSAVVKAHPDSRPK